MMRRALVICLALGSTAVTDTAGAQEQPPQLEAELEAEREAQEDNQHGEPALEVLVVGDVPTAARADPTPAVYVIRGDALTAPGLGAAELLTRVPGLQATRSGGSADRASASLRGASGAQTPVYLAGVRLNDPLTGGVDLSTLPLWMLHRVEIYRGNAPAGTDQLGIGGAILLEPRLPNRTEARATLGFGSFGEREGRAGLMIGDHQAGAALAVRHGAGAGDFDFVDDGGTRFDTRDDVVRKRQNADHQQLDVWSLGMAQLGRVRLTGVVNAWSREAGAPGLQLLGASHSRSSERRVIAGTSASLPCSGADAAGGAGADGRAGCALHLDVGASAVRYRLDDPLRELGPNRLVETAGERLTQRLRLAFPIGSDLKLSVGAGQAIELVRVDLDAQPAQRARRQLLRGELHGLWDPLDELTVAAVGALPCHTTAAAGADGPAEETCGVLEPVGRLGVRWRPLPQIALSSNLGRYVRVPTLGELYGISEVVRGNPALAVEEGMTIDAGLAAELAARPVALWAQVVGFVRFADALIGYRRATFGAVRPYNTGSARVLGVEIASGARLWRRVDVGTSVTLLDPRDTSENRTVQSDLLPLQARLVVAPYLELSSPPWPLVGLDRAAISVRYLHRASRVADPAGLILLDEQHDVELSASLAFAERLALRGRVSNLLDRLSYDLIGYPLPGRAGHVSMEVWW